jgi:hypothetical protein
MRLIWLTTVFEVAIVAAAAAQPASRFTAGPVVRLDRVFIEGDASGTTPVGGALATFSITKTYGIEGELTWASRAVERSYEGRFISYVQTPNPTREEIERAAPTARRTLRYTPGMGWSMAFVARGELSPRVSLAARAGAAARRYRQTSDYTILTIPEGVDPARVARDFQSSSSHKLRGGLLLGVDVPIAVSRRFAVAPEFRLVYGGPARVGDKYRELSLGVRGVWRF